MLSPSWRSQGVYIVHIFFYHSLFSLLVLYIALKSLVQKLDCRLEKSEASGSKRKVGFLRYQWKNSYPHSDSLPNDALPWSYQRSRTQVCLLIFFHHAHILWKLFYIYIQNTTAIPSLNTDNTPTLHDTPTGVCSINKPTGSTSNSRTSASNGHNRSIHSEFGTPLTHLSSNKKRTLDFIDSTDESDWELDSE